MVKNMLTYLPPIGKGELDPTRAGQTNWPDAQGGTAETGSRESANQDPTMEVEPDQPASEPKE